MRETFHCCIEFGDDAGITALQSWQQSQTVGETSIWTCPDCGQVWRHLLLGKVGIITNTWRKKLDLRRAGAAQHLRRQ